MAVNHNEGLFGSIEFKALSLTSLPKWTDVLEKIKNEEELFRVCKVDSTRCKEESYAKWIKFIEKNKSVSSIQTKLDNVNTFANKWPYKTDFDVWQMSDYWESPAEFLKYSGDCEDYAITKFVSLKKLGIPPKDLRIVVLYDTIRNIAHAVLSVKVKDKYYIMDSLINMVVEDETLPHYIPQYSVNDTTRWAHIMPQAIKQYKEESKEELNPELLLFDSYGEDE
jgi:predicted transglutaminase-like cysteine proteinase